MTFREPTFQELFPISHSLELDKLQSTHLVNQSHARGGITEAFINMPLNLPEPKPHKQLVLESSVASNLTTNYIKANWRVIVASAIIGGIIVYAVVKINQQNKKNKLKKYLD